MRKYYISKFFALSVILMMNLNLINAQSRSIKGYVCNDSGDRLPGAIVRLVGEDDNIITDAMVSLVQNCLTVQNICW